MFAIERFLWSFQCYLTLFSIVTYSFLVKTESKRSESDRKFLLSLKMFITYFSFLSLCILLNVGSLVTFDSIGFANGEYLEPRLDMISFANSLQTKYYLSKSTTLPTPTYKFETAYAHLIGDPHVRALNGKDFDCMGDGEYVLFVLPTSSVQSTDMIPLRVHATFLGRSNGPGSVTTGIGVRVRRDIIFKIVLDDENGLVVLGKCIASIQLSTDGPRLRVLRGRHTYSESVDIEYTGIWIVLYVKNNSTGDTKLRMVFETVRTVSIGCYFSLVHLLIPTKDNIMTTRTKGLFGSVQNGFKKPNGKTFYLDDKSNVRYCNLWCVKNIRFSMFKNFSSTCKISPLASMSSVKQIVSENEEEIQDVCGSNVLCRFDAFVNGIRAARAFMRALFISETIGFDSISSSPLVSNAPVVRFSYVSKNRGFEEEKSSINKFYDG